jgi:glutaredoxin
MAQRIEIFSACCPLCEAAEHVVRKLAGPHQEIVVHDVSADSNAAAVARAAAHGITVVPSVVVDGELLGCCRNAGPDLDQLAAAGVGRPHTAEA